MSHSNGWFKYILSSANPEDDCFLLFDFGVVGSNILPSGQIECFLDEKKSTPEDFEQLLIESRFQIINKEYIKEDNWVANCQEIIRPIQAGEISIVPVISATSNEIEISKNKIYIIPGLGFGTGHHASTRLAIQNLLMIKSNHITHALDVGTGSGILAFAINKIFQCNVDACDIDPLALENAKDNAALNACDKAIDFSQQSIEGINKKYPLIVANIYAEVLCNMQADFVKCLNPGGFLVLSGIMQNLSPAVEKAFSLPGFQKKHFLSEDGWVSLLYEYNPEHKK
jgi:ribosomal protein L11 methyltransferase